MGRVLRKRKVAISSQRDFKLNGSISTYGKSQTRLLYDAPNFNWLPSDDSFRGKGKPVLGDVTNRQSQTKHVLQLKPRKICLDIFDSDSDDDFKPAKVAATGTRKLRSRAVVLSNTPRQLSCQNQVKENLRNKKTVEQKSKGEKKTKKILETDTATTKEDIYSCGKMNSPMQIQGVESQRQVNPTPPEIDGENRETHECTVETLNIPKTSCDKSKLCRMQVPVIPNLTTTVNSMQQLDVPLPQKQDCIDDRFTESLNCGEFSSIKNGELCTTSAAANSAVISTDLFSSSYMRTSRVMSNSVVHCESEATRSCQNPKSPQYTQSFNSTVIGHAADFQVTDQKVPQSGKPDPKSTFPIISSTFGIIQSTPVMNTRKLRTTKTTRQPSPNMLSAVVQMHTHEPTTHDAKLNPKRRRLKPKLVKKNRQKKFQKPNPLSRRVVNKCNRSIKSSKNSSILQHIMVGNPVYQNFKYDFLDNSKDAYFVDTSSTSAIGVRLNSTRTKEEHKSKENISTKNQLVVPDAMISVLGLSNKSIGASDEDVFHSPKLNNQISINPITSKKKRLRKKSRVNYKLLLSGEWYDTNSKSHLKSAGSMIGGDLKLNKGVEIPFQNEDSALSENLQEFHQRLKEGNVNQRRKRKQRKPVSDSCNFYTPLNFQSHDHHIPDPMQSPNLPNRSDKDSTSKLARHRIRTRSPGSHLRTPVRVCSKAQIVELKSSCVSNCSSNHDSPSLVSRSQQKSFHLCISNLSDRSTNSKFLEQSLGFAKALSPVADRSFANDQQKVLMECNQAEPINFDSVLSKLQSSKCNKLGEGVYGEVYGIHLKSIDERIAMKVVPIEGDCAVNGEEQKTCGEILPEILSSKELTKLSSNLTYSTDGFIKLHAVHCVKGKYPDNLLKAWDLYDEEECSENDRPDMFTENQLYILLLYSDGGTDVEHFKFYSATQAYSVVQQVCAALAVAEKTLEFEHRDLHWGNILVAPTNLKELSYVFDGETFNIQTRGVKATIIDFTLSRLSKDGVTVFQDLSNDPEIFEGDADVDIQFEIYRRMKECVRDDWSRFHPKTNVFWTHYIVKKFIKDVKYAVSKRSCHLSALRKCRSLGNDLLEFNSCVDALLSCSKLALMSHR